MRTLIIVESPAKARTLVPIMLSLGVEPEQSNSERRRLIRGEAN